MAVTKRAGRKAKGKDADPSGSSGGQPRVKKAVFETQKKKEVGVTDLTLISKISNEAINENLKKRFENAEIYTYIGHVLISVNPFRDLGIYTDEVLESYRGKNRLEVPPHVFAVAESAYYNMNGYKESQCIIISGESGAGKTEAAKQIMQYIAAASSASSTTIQEIKDMVLATNPLLESFGCAKTLRNNNSSRHGKYLEIQFNDQGEPVGANITNYLLEKGRVVGQIKDERNFHIFYQYTKAAPQQYRETFGIQTPDTYLYTSKSNCLDVPGIDDTAEFAETMNAMKTIGLSQEEQDNIFRMLSVVLWLGNIQFVEDEQGNGAISDSSVTDFVAYLLEVDGAAVHKALTIRVVETGRGGRRGSVYEVPLNVTQATAVRDALGKAIYNNLFEWIVERVNLSMKTRGSVAHTIGILDIYGFEIFENNSFEQICINYVNEKLQQIFIQLTLRTEQEEYAREEITWTPIKYFDNKVVCDLIEEKRPPGVFAALNDACATAHADSGAADGTFVQRLNMLSSNPHFENRQGHFLVKHYAGDVMYTVAGMTDKNKDQLLKDLLDLVEQSGNGFLRTIFPVQIDRDSKRRPPTASDKIKVSANDLVTTLMKSQPSYIRTIKPNQNKSPKEYDTPAVLHQVKYLGLQENVRIRRAGFAYRQTFEKFVERFYLLSPKTSYAGDYTWTGDARSGASQILKDTSIPKEEYQMGVTKAFIKTPETLFALETMRDRYWHNMAIRIQRAWRNYLRYRAESATRIQRAWRKKRGGEVFLKVRDEGHRILAGRKERRRMSLLGSRRFMGDYLGVGNKGGPGEMIRNSVGISASELVLFSCRGELLVSKLGRSSRPSPRMIVMTNRAIYIIIQAMINGQLSISSERTVVLSSVKFVGMSNLQDDWFSLGVGAAQEPDPLISCIFKTELVTHMRTTMPGGVDIRIGPTIEYSKKPGKLAVVKTVKDPSVQRGDLYKSSTIHVGPGEPASSISRPTPKGKPVAAKPITSGKLLTPGGPGGGAHAGRKVLRAGPVPQPAEAALRPVPHPVAPQESRPVVRSVPITNTHARNSSAGSSTRVPPPPPPAPPAHPPTAEPTCKALYDFQRQSANELSLAKDEVVIIIRKEENGWWLTKKMDNEEQGWVPSAYLKEEPARPLPPAVRSVPPPPPPPPPPANGTSRNGAGPPPPASRPVGKKPAPPAPPAKRPIAGRKPVPVPAPVLVLVPAPAPAPTSGSAESTRASLTESTGSGSSGAGSSTTSFAGGLAQALKDRQQAMRGNKEEDDDW